MHRFLWDLHYAPSVAPGNDLPMQAVPQDTPFGPSSPWVLPGRYTVKLTFEGKAYSQPLTVRMDRRVKTPAAGLEQQFALSMQLYNGAGEVTNAADQLRSVREQLKARAASAGQGALADEIASIDKKLEALGGSQAGMFAFFRRGVSGPDTMMSLRFGLLGLMEGLQAADVSPTAAQIAAVADRRRALANLIEKWTALKDVDLKELNRKLEQANLPVVDPALQPESQ